MLSETPYIKSLRSNKPKSEDSRTLHNELVQSTVLAYNREQVYKEESDEGLIKLKDMKFYLHGLGSYYPLVGIMLFKFFAHGVMFWTEINLANFGNAADKFKPDSQDKTFCLES